MLSLPEGHKSYNRQVNERCREKIKATRSWSGIDLTTLTAWINNFKGEKEIFLAHRLLDLLIYRSEEHLFSLLQSLFYQSIPTLLVRNGICAPKDSLAILKGLSSRNSFVKIALNAESNDPTSSASEVARRIKTRFNVNEQNIIFLNEIKALPNSNGKVVIVVDDFSGTGKQFIKNLVKQNYKGYANIFFAPLVAHSHAISCVHSELVSKGMISDVETVELLDNKYHIFHPESKCFYWHGSSHLEACRHLYEEIMRDRLQDLSKRYWYGRENQGLLFSFHYRCPNNAIPLLWYSGDKWTPLIRR